MSLRYATKRSLGRTMNSVLARLGVDISPRVSLRQWLPGVRQGQIDSSLLDEDLLRRLERLTLLSGSTKEAALIGEHRSWRRASSFEFADHRRYVAGDDYRRIDWNVYGRLDGLFLKLNEAREDIPIHILLDCSKSMDCGEPHKLTYAKKLVASLAYLALSRFDSVSVVSFSDRLHQRYPMVKGKSQTVNLLDFLNGVEVGTTTRLLPSIVDYSHMYRHAGLMVIISDFLTSEDLEEGIAVLTKSGYDVQVVHLLAADELDPIVTGELELLDSESGEIVEITVGPNVIVQYKERVSEWMDEVENRFKSLGVRYVAGHSGVPLEHLIMNTMRQKGLVG